MKNAFKILAILSLLIACHEDMDNRSKDNDKRKSGDVESSSGETKESEPSSISGTNLLKYDNSSTGCLDVKELGVNKYKVDCYALVETKKGHKVKANAIDKNITIAWQQPLVVSGAPFAAKTCAPSADGLSYSCEISMESSVATKVEFGLAVTENLVSNSYFRAMYDTPSERTKVEVDVIDVPMATVFSAGSFKVWTVPNDPAPGEDYQIHIEFALPAGTLNYPSDDLSGSVVGTDAYRAKFGEGDYPSEYIDLVPTMNVVDSKAIFVLPPVLGGQEAIVDTIKIKSKVLKEEQTITISF